MTEEAFQAAIEEAKKLEKKTIDYSPYEGDINIEKSLEIEPEEYVDLTYNDLRNLYARTQKILSTAGMGILAERGKEEVKVSAQSQKVEMKLKDMTKKTLKEAEEIAKGPEIEVEAAPPPEEHIELEREEPKVPTMEEVPPVETEKEIEIERIEAPPEEIEIPKEEVPAKEIEKPAPPAEKPEERAVAPPPIVPPTLRESPDKEATKRYTEIEEQIRSALGEEADELALKKKMLELTKQLFKEKTTSKKEEIKLQIKVLKNMLTSMRERGKRRKKQKTEAQVYDTMITAQKEELAQIKDKITESYKKQIKEVKEKFYSEVGATEDPKEKKKIYETFVSTVTLLVEGLPEAIEKENTFVSEKHSAEMKKLIESLSEKDKDLREKAEERLGYIEEKHGKEFEMVKRIIGREMENLIEIAGAEIFEKPEEKKTKKKEIKPTEIVKEINETDDGTLLYFLHSKDPEYYKQYERKQVAKAEAIFKAKELMAKEKGLNKTMIKKYFSEG